MKNIFRGLYVWKWGFNFNEGGMFSQHLPFTMAINLYNLRFFMILGIPWIFHQRSPFKFSKEKVWFIGWKPIINIVLKK